MHQMQDASILTVAPEQVATTCKKEETLAIDSIRKEYGMELSDIRARHEAKVVISALACKCDGWVQKLVDSFLHQEAQGSGIFLNDFNELMTKTPAPITTGGIKYLTAE